MVVLLFLLGLVAAQCFDPLPCLTETGGNVSAQGAVCAGRPYEFFVRLLAAQNVSGCCASPVQVRADAVDSFGTLVASFFLPLVACSSGSFSFSVVAPVTGSRLSLTTFVNGTALPARCDCFAGGRAAVGVAIADCDKCVPPTRPCEPPLANPQYDSGSNVPHGEQIIFKFD